MQQLELSFPADHHAAAAASAACLHMNMPKSKPGVANEDGGKLPSHVKN